MPRKIRQLNVKEELEMEWLREVADKINRKERSAIGRQERIKVERDVVNGVAQESWYCKQRKAQQRVNALEGEFRKGAGEGLHRREQIADQLLQAKAARWATLPGRDTLKHAKALSSRQEQERTAERESVDHFKRQLVAEDSALRRQERLSKERQLLQTFQGIDWGHRRQRFVNTRDLVEEDFKGRAARALIAKEGRYQVRHGRKQLRLEWLQYCQKLLNHRRAMNDMLAAEADYLSRQINRLVGKRHTKGPR
ncbi:hypothetical protein Pmar_PMAR011169 [Perkinsus marinus ATCC 50983]|uniref:Uncharacterized protein n=1 Tax=Perkinsus marinus (strain ATCC 50983 / TXsc) TaxID=423536 RepID=C5L1N8_PERM5|nr:hypothetical protein Pmar_PMAR011169 [Perkinsus marinus ATCC 50983]EER09350.1 hypothetical protein Pmar_PMAR011169 [Perkinsus marinus ATCC 50983]|eukprot:XP_002777534.1 hypothetical protein Pmar_PMAR011169 [Perkinsus marinus ATCC 50983]